MPYSQNINSSQGNEKMDTSFRVSEFLINPAIKLAKKMAETENILAIDGCPNFFVTRNESYDSTAMIAVHHFTTDDGKQFNIIMKR